MAKGELTKARLKPQRSRNKFLREKRDRKRAEAQARQAAYDALTLEQKLAKLEGFAAVKQRAKLLATTIKLNEVEAAKVDALLANPPEPTETLKKAMKGTKARRQAKKDKKGKK